MQNAAKVSAVATLALLASISSTVAAVTPPAKALKPKVTIIGIDGAEWSIINSLRSEGRLPTFDRLIKEGASGRMESIEPLFTPIVWTTIATGKAPREHGIRGFTSINPETGAKIPVNRTMRRTPAIWNILSQRGVKSLVTAWYATWPAEKINGAIVSDYTWNFKNSEQSEEFLESKVGIAFKDQTYPTSLLDRIKDLFLDKDAERAAYVRRFGLKPLVSPYALKHSYAKDTTYFRIWKRLRRAASYDFTAVYLQGPDLLSHQFFDEWTRFDAGELRKDAPDARLATHVERYYEYVDFMLAHYDAHIRQDGELLLILSDHGFEDKKRPVLTKVSDDRFAKMRYWHRRYGILIAHGPGVRRGAWVSSATIFDVAPTVLALFRLPLAGDMSGKPIAEIVGSAKRFEGWPRVSSYDAASARAPKLRTTPYDKSILKRLNDLGYIQ